MSSAINLYNSSEEIIAMFYELNPSGYIIVRADTDEVIEYSYEDNSYINNDLEHYYYSGPLVYYKRTELKSGYVVTNLKTQEVLELSEMSELKKPIDNESSLTLYNFQILPRTGSWGNIDYSTEAYTYMPHNGCGATAAGIVLKYYDDHVSNSYIPSRLESTNGKLIIDAIYSDISEPEDGSTYAELKGALNIYLKGNYKAHSVTSVTSNWWYSIKNQIDENKPCILDLTSNSTYGAHWVVVTGYNFSSSDARVYIVNDGWGSTGVRVNSIYTDGCIYF